MRLASQLATLSMALLVLAGCGDDNCSKSGDRLSECLVDKDKYSGIFENAYKCEATNLCKAQCINASDCAAIVDAYSGMPTEKGAPFLRCIANCDNAPK